ncbi:transposase [Penicillium chermesinum]|nr:transposase [Penicillium chermesinum]
MGKLYAIADLHLSYKYNLEALEALHHVHQDDGLILAGDIGESATHLHSAFRWAKSYFHSVWWCPGNHELYTLPLSAKDRAAGGGSSPPARGEAKYEQCIAIARQYGVITPEDEFVTWDCNDGTPLALVCPIFTLYDYSFRPPDVTREKALAWAEEQGICATDEVLLHPDPYATRDMWCAALVSRFEARLESAVREKPDLPLIIANHWPLHESVVHLPAVPRFRLWCGTTRTGDWHTRFHAKVVVSGHLHLRRTDWVDGVRFEEVSLGYPRQWERARSLGKDINSFLREILPGPLVVGQEGVTQWRPNGDIICSGTRESSRNQ